MQLTQRYSILSLLQAVLGGVIALTTIAAYKIAPAASLPQSSLTISIAGLGAVAAVYYLSIHQLVKGRYLQQSSGVLSLITAVNILLLIVATGGLDSPYFALWLLAIVIAGLFGRVATTSAVVATLGFYGYEFMAHQSQSGYIVGHGGQLAITVATGVIAEWLHVALGRSSAQHQQVTQLSGQLSEEELKANVLMQSVAEGVLVVNTRRQIQLFNPAATRLTGWDKFSAQNIDYRLVLNLRDAKGNKLADSDDPFAQMWQKEKSLVRTDLSMLTHSGRKIAISLSLSPIFDTGHKVSGGIALFRDISAEKEIERQRNEFISTASHEMRTPVAAIEGYLSLAMNPNVATVDERARGYLNKAHDSTQHLGALFQDLLSITKLEDGAKVDTRQIFDLTKLVEDVVADMQFTAAKHGLELQFSLAGESVRGQQRIKPVYAVRGNVQRLREVVMNLIENAIKFTPEGRIRVMIGGTSDTTTVSVVDNGIGIASEDISHLFQKFYRIDSGTTRTIGGTGLGLYLCRTIIELLGGRIWVESKLGEGSSFRFSLPRVSSNKIPAPPAVPVPAEGVRPIAPTNLRPRAGVVAGTAAAAEAAAPTSTAATSATATAAATTGAKPKPLPQPTMADVRKLVAAK